MTQTPSQAVPTALTGASRSKGRDEQSGLLVRIMRYAESPLGRDPTQIDYADYRVVDGVQIPFRVTLSEPEAVSTIQLQSVEQNVQIDDTRFAQPQGTRSSTSPVPAKPSGQPR